MSDETIKPAAPVEADKAAAAAAMLAVQDLADEVAGVKKQVRGLWITVIVTIVLVIVLAGFTLLPRLLGVSAFGGGARRFNPQNGQGFQPGGTNQQAPQGTTPSQ
jgi:hypothetical protein